MHHALVLLHVFSATIALLSGALAMILRKGSGGHGAAGTVFAVSMLSMAGTGAFMSVVYKPVAANVVAGLLTVYLVATSWRAAKNRTGKLGNFDRVALLFIALVALRSLLWGFEAVGSPTGMKDQMPAAGYFVFGTAALLCAVTDVRMLRRGTLLGADRLVRHLWRMGLAFLIAALSFYPGQARLFPDWLRDTRLLMVPHLLLLGSIVLWRLRLRRQRRASQAGAVLVPAVVRT